MKWTREMHAQSRATRKAKDVLAMLDRIEELEDELRRVRELLSETDAAIIDDLLGDDR